MAKTETTVSNLKINRGTYAKIQENLSSIGENELIITTDKNIPVPTSNDSGKVIKVNASGEYELSTDSSGMSNPMTTQGDLIVGGTSGNPERLGKGTTGQILKSTASGVEWANETSDTIPTVTIALSQVVSQTPLQIQLTQSQYDIFAANKQVIIDASALGETTMVWNFLIDDGSYISFGVMGIGLYYVNGNLFAINKTSLIVTVTQVNINDEIGFNADGDIHINSERDLNIYTGRNSNIYSLEDVYLTTEDGDITLTAQTTDDPMTSSSPGKLTLNADNGVYLANSDNSSNKDKYLHSNATTGAIEWVASPGGSQATVSTLGLIKLGSSTQAGTMETASSKSGRYYPLQVDANGQASVNVPWTDTVYTPDFDTDANVISLVDDIFVSYTITTSVTNGTYSGSATIDKLGTASVTIIPDSDYDLPSSVTVSGATSSYNSTTGVITLSNATGNLTISAVCEAQVSGITITITNEYGQTVSIYDGQDTSGNYLGTVESSDSFPPVPPATFIITSGYVYTSNGAFHDITSGDIFIGNPALITEPVELTIGPSLPGPRQGQSME